MAKPAGPPRFRSTKPEDLLFMIEWRKPYGHPCAPYLPYWEAKLKKEDIAYGEALGKILKSGKPTKESRELVMRKPRKRKKFPKIPIIIGIIAILIIAFFIVSKSCPEGERLYNGECIPYIECSDGTLHPECSEDKPKQCFDGKLIDNAQLCGCPEDYKPVGKICEKIKRCEDGTIYGECSKDKPYFCSAGKLVKNAQLCGCEWGYQPYGEDCIDNSKAESIEATDYINEIRNEYGRTKIKWDENLYELAMFRTKDMYNRKYFDHVTPEGKCVKDFKSEYGLSNYNIAENCGGVMYSYDETYVDYASYANVKEQIDGWMESRGHRYNLLYPSHTLGVAACYKGACVFLGANKEYYGLGYGPCTTGEEGLEYWESVGKQPGEI